MVFVFDEHVKRELLITTMENLSNELFYEIFAYLDGFTLYKAFSKLNHRFNDLISVQTLKFTSDTLESSDDIEEYFSLVQQHQNRIISLVSDRMDLLHGSYTSLHSLVLSKVSLDMFDCYYDLLFNLPRLHHLEMQLIDQQQTLSDLYRMILYLPALKSFQCSAVVLQTKIEIPMDSIKVTSPIEYLVINHPVCFNQLHPFLSFVPHLKNLKCERVWKIRQVGFFPRLLTDLHLTHLSICSVMFDFQTFTTWLLHDNLRLRSLCISIRDNTPTYFHADQWEKLFNQMKSIDLQLFKLDFHTYINDDSPLPTYLEQLRQFSSPFWTERDWQFELIAHWYYGIQYQMFYKIVSNQQQLKLNKFHRSMKYECSIPSRMESSGLSMITCGSLLHLVRIVSQIQLIFEPIHITDLCVSFRFIDLKIFRDLSILLPHITTLHVMYDDNLNFHLLTNDSQDVASLEIQNKQINRLILQSVQKTTSIEFFLNLCFQLEFLQIDSVALINNSNLFESFCQKFVHPLTLCVITPSNDCPIIFAQLRKMIGQKQFEIVRKNDRIYLHII